MTNSWINVCPLIIGLALGIKDVIGNPSSYRSIGSEYEVDIEEFPWQAAVITPGGPGLQCGAVIITNWHVLTAVSCVFFHTPETMHINAGSSIFEGGINYKVRSIHTHPNFTTDFPFPHDIALIELDEEIQLDATKFPIFFPHKDVPSGATVTLTGWGLKPWGTFSKHLKKQQLTIIDNEKCDAIAFESAEDIPDVPLDSSQMCGMPIPDTTLCQANTGTGIIYEGTLVGISAMDTGCHEHNPEIFTRVYQHLDWIRDVLDD